MADLSITAGNVIPQSNALIDWGFAAVTIAAGDAVLRDPATGLVTLADADAGAEESVCSGIAVASATAGQPIPFQTAGDVAIGSTGTAEGTILVVSDTAGNLAPSGDLDSGWYTTIIGVMATANLLKLRLYSSGVVWV